MYLVPQLTRTLDQHERQRSQQSSEVSSHYQSLLREAEERTEVREHYSMCVG